jgi:SAM-dependent methyltransferase
VYEWLAELKAGQRVLDIASGPGSFPMAGLACTAIAIDEDVDAFGTAAPLPPGQHARVFGKSERLPFNDASFDLIVCNHALEHLEQLEAALDEMRRVLKPDGRLYVSVPFGFGVCDGVYRWVFEGGGHVNRLRREQVIELVQRRLGLKLVRWQKLYSSFVYLHRLLVMMESPPPNLPRRLMRIAKLPKAVVKAAQRSLYVGTRMLDRRAGTSTALYGWAFWFAREADDAVEEPAYINVCMYCGAGHPAASLSAVSRGTYTCPVCNGRNPFTRD